MTSTRSLVVRRAGHFAVVEVHGVVGHEALETITQTFRALMDYPPLCLEIDLAMLSMSDDGLRDALVDLHDAVSAGSGQVRLVGVSDAAIDLLRGSSLGPACERLAIPSAYGRSLL